MKKIRHIIYFAWGKALMAEGFFWEFIGNNIGNKWLRDKMIYRAVAVGVTGANLLTDGMAFPGIETPGCTRRGTHDTGKNQGEK